MSTQSASQIASNAANEIYNNFQIEMGDLLNLSLEIGNDNAAINWDNAHLHYKNEVQVGPTEWTTVVETDQSIEENLNSVQGHLNNTLVPAYDGDISALKSLGPAFKSVIEALNAVIGLNQHGKLSEAIDVLTNQQMRDQLINHLVERDAEDLLNAAGISAGIQALEQSDVPGSSEEICQLAAERNHDNANVENDAEDLQTIIYNDEQTYLQAEQNAEIDNSHFSTAQIWMRHLFFMSLSKAHDQKIISHSQAMLKVLDNLSSAMTGLSVSCGNSNLDELLIMVQSILSTVKKILSDKDLSIKGKMTQLLPLMMELLGILKLVQQVAENQKNRYELDMEKAQMRAAQNQIQQMKTNQAVQAEITANNAIGQVAQFCETLIMGCLFAGFASGIASLVILTLTLLQAFKVTSKWETDIATDIAGKNASKGKTEASKIWAAVIMTTVEVAVTLLGAFAGDFALSSEMLMSIVAKTTAKDLASTAMTDSEEAIQLATDKIMAKLSQSALNLTRDQVEQTVRTIGEKAAKAVAKRLMVQIFKQSIAMTLKTLAKKEAQNLLEGTVREAVSSAIAKSATLADDIALSGLPNEEVLNELASNTANQAISDATKKSVEDITQESSRSTLRSVGRRLAFSSAYGIGSTNMLVDIATWGLHHDHKENGKGAAALLITLSILQGLMQAVGMMVAGGFLNQATLGSPSLMMTKFQRASATIQSIAQEANAANSYANGQIDQTKGKVQQEEQINSMLSRFLQDFLSHFVQDGMVERQAFIKQQAEETKSQRFMVMNFENGDREAIRILTEQAI